MIQSAAENACFEDATTEVITVTADIPITGRNNFGISAFFSGRVLRKEISLPRQIR